MFNLRENHAIQMCFFCIVLAFFLFFFIKQNVKCIVAVITDDHWMALQPYEIRARNRFEQRVLSELIWKRLHGVFHSFFTHLPPSLISTVYPNLILVIFTAPHSAPSTLLPHTLTSAWSSPIFPLFSYESTALVIRMLFGKPFLWPRLDQSIFF